MLHNSLEAKFTNVEILGDFVEKNYSGRAELFIKSSNAVDHREGR